MSRQVPDEGMANVDPNQLALDQSIEEGDMDYSRNNHALPAGLHSSDPTGSHFATGDVRTKRAKKSRGQFLAT